jgi:hypothetical protein
MPKAPVAKFKKPVGRDVQPLVRWVFQREQDLLTCEVAVGRSAYEVSVVPHGDVSQSVIEPFDRASDALWRHAQIASRLRERGWIVAEHLPMGRVRAA